MHTLAIDIGGAKTTLARFDGDRLMEKRIEPTDRAAGRTPLLDRLAVHLSALRAAQSIDRCGVSFGGPVDFANQRVYHSTHAPGWSDFDLVGWLRDRLGDIPVVIDNDANAGALGEARHGAGRAPNASSSGPPYDPLFHMTLSTGIGGAVVSGGRVLRGADSYAGEIGHLTIRPDGPVCLCGARGCLERLCCGLWLERDHGRPAKVLLEDPAFVARYVVDLAQGLKAAIMLLNPARIVIAGGIAKAGDALFIPLRAELARQITDWSHARIDVLPAAHPDDCTLFGALELAKNF
jgi:glucokinase